MEYAPDWLLSGLMKCFWTTQRSFYPPHNTFQVIPDSYVEILFSAGAPCFLVTPTQQLPMPACYVVNLLDKPFTVYAEGTVSLLGIRLYAWSIQALFQEEQPGFTRPVMPLPSALAYLEPDIVSYLQQDRPQEAVAYLQRALTSQLKPTLSLPQQRALLLREFMQTAELASPAELARQFNVSTRQVQRLLKASSGVSPKMLFRLSRFERARDQLWHQPESNLTALAYELGYADQAHFSRDFRAFSRQSPRQFVRQVRRWRNQ